MRGCGSQSRYVSLAACGVAGGSNEWTAATLQAPRAPRCHDARRTSLRAEGPGMREGVRCTVPVQAVPSIDSGSVYVLSGIRVYCTVRPYAVVSTPFSCAVTADPVSAYRISGRLAGPRETRDDRRWFIQSSIYEYRLQPTLQVVASRTRWFRTIRFKLASAPVAWSVHIHAKAAL